MGWLWPRCSVVADWKINAGQGRSKLITHRIIDIAGRSPSIAGRSIADYITDITSGRWFSEGEWWFTDLRLPKNHPQLQLFIWGCFCMFLSPLLRMDLAGCGYPGFLPDAGVETQQDRSQPGTRTTNIGAMGMATPALATTVPDLLGNHQPIHSHAWPTDSPHVWLPAVGCQHDTRGNPTKTSWKDWQARILRGFLDQPMGLNQQKHICNITKQFLT